MPKPKTAELKQQAIQQYLQLVKKWNWTKNAKSQRELNRMGYQSVRDELTKLQAKRESIIQDQNLKLSEQGRRDKIKRPSGLILTRRIPLESSGIMFYKNLEANRKPNQIIKLVVKTSENTTEYMLLENFIKWIDGYESSSAIGAGKVIDIYLYTLHLSGGCSTKGNVKSDIEVNGWIFNCITVETKDNDCIFAVMQKFKGGRGKYGKGMRKELGFEIGKPISTDDLQKIADYYEMNIVLYYVFGEEVIMLDYKSVKESEKVASVLLLNDHYYYVQKVITPEFKQIKTKFDSLIQNIVKTDNCQFERITEDEMGNFDNIVNYVQENDKKHIFIHGQAGVGKSVLSKKIEQTYTNNGLRLLISSTQGISALSIGGVTIHSLLKRYQKKGFPCDVLIDEIGFLDGSVFDEVIKAIGIHRLIIVGDLKQLPPVKYEQYGFFFEAMGYKEIHNNMTLIELTKVKRQENEKFVNILSKIRLGQFDQEVFYLFKSRQTKSKDAPEGTTIIASRNNTKDEYNNKAIQRLIEQGAQSKEFIQKQSWDMNLLKELYQDEEEKMKQYMAKHSKNLDKTKALTLYIDEQVILTQNMMYKGLANGSRGIIVGFEENAVIVNFEVENRIETITPVIKYKKSVQELYSEKIPLVPAYALTIHKAQGMTIRTPLYVNLENLWRLELLYVALSRVTDESLLMLFNPPTDRYFCKRLTTNSIVNNYLETGYFEQFGFRMVIEDFQKQMQIAKRPDTKLFQLNQIDFDFETAEFQTKSGLIHHKPYYNHITHYKNGKKVNAVTYEDYIQKTDEQGNKIPLVSENFNGNDVAQLSFDFIMKEVKKYEKQLEIAKKTNDRQVIKDMINQCVRLVSFNGAGFDLYFLLEKLLQTEGFSTLYEIRNIFKGNKLVRFVLYSLTSKQVVLQSFDIFQIVSPFGLEKACKSYCPDQAQKLKFKNEIIYLAKNRYKNPEIMNDEETRLTSEEIVTIQDIGSWKMDSLKTSDGWIIEDFEIERLQKISEREDAIGRRYKVKIYKTMNLRQSLDEYAKNDTEVLSILLKSLDDICHKEFDCSILNFLTAGSLCWYGFQYYAPKELYAEEKYDQNRNKKTRKHGNKLKTHLYRNELDEEVFTLKSIIGGKTGPRMKQLPQLFDPKTHKRHTYVYLDISGMYCDLMMEYKYPFGKKRWLNKNEMEQLQNYLKKNVPGYIGDKLKTLTEIKQKVIEIHDKYFPCMFICDAEFSENCISLEPMIAYKKRIAGSDEKPIHKTMYTNEKRNQTITSIDLITILLKGGQLESINKCLVFEKSGMILRDWMIKCLEIKNRGKKEKLDALTAFGKLLANGTYGQTLKQDKHEVIKFVDSEWDVDEFVQNYQLKNAFITESDTDILIGSELVDKKEYVTSRCSYIGSFVLAYSRLVIQDICQTINPEQDPLKQPLYGDTDSLVCRKDLVVSRMIQAGYVQAKSGLLADELADTCEQQFFYPPDPKNITEKDIRNPDNYKFCLIDEGYFIQPKTIAIHYNDIPHKNEDDKEEISEEHTKIRAKGIPVNSCYGDDKECMSYKLFVDLLEKSKMLGGQQVDLPEGIKGDFNKYGEEIKLNGRKIKKNEGVFKIVGNQMTRKIFNTQYKGRAISTIDDNIFVPYGHPLAPDNKEDLPQQTQKKELTAEEQEEYDFMMDMIDDCAFDDDCQ